MTNAESMEEPKELGGGILADEMGMGKSLSTLALIMETSSVSEAWSKESSLLPQKQRSQATLIIVPSTRTY